MVLEALGMVLQVPGMVLEVLRWAEDEFHVNSHLKLYKDELGLKILCKSDLQPSFAEGKALLEPYRPEDLAL